MVRRWAKFFVDKNVFDIVDHMYSMVAILGILSTMDEYKDAKRVYHVVLVS